MKIEIWSDIACPWCYVGKRRFEQALSQFEHRDDVEVVWRSFELDPSAPRGYEESQAELLAKKYGMPVEQAQAMNARMTGEAKKEGLSFDFEKSQPGNTFDAHRLIHLAAAHGKREAMVERLFAGYLTEGAAIGEKDTLQRLATEVGLDAEQVREVLDGSAYADAVRADEGRARTFGISGVPFFAIDERYGVSGAQTPDVLLETLRQAHGESRLVVVAGEEGASCDDGGCTI
jgi:predicted DsbA family dithiol-disulfide isomerase